MADRAGRGSFGSSSTEAGTVHDDEKGRSSDDGSYPLKAPEEMEIADEEAAELLPAEVRAAEKSGEPEKTSARVAVIWMVVNTLATIGIVRILHHDSATQIK
jgi:solute carrier family 35 protein E3